MMNVVSDNPNLARQLRNSTTTYNRNNRRTNYRAHYHIPPSTHRTRRPVTARLNPEPRTLNPEPSSIQHLLRLRIILPAHRHPPVVLRRPIKFRRKRLG